MAMNEVTLLRSTKHPYGGISRRVLYWYDLLDAVDVPGGIIKDTKNNTIAATPSSNLPEDAKRYTDVEVGANAALDTGNAGFEVFEFWQSGGEPNAALQVRLLADHAARQTWWVQDQRDRYALSGIGVSG
jgi:hypothetical protein